MFVTKKMAVMAAAFVTMAGMATGATAADAVSGHDVKVPVTVTFNGVQPSDVPFYVSIQTEADYRSMKGSGGVLKSTEAGTFTRTFNVPEGGDYAISVWHDLDNDGRFSMTQDYKIVDGWGTSGTVPMGTAPSFDDAKVNVSGYGTDVTIDIIYPKS
jgi:uncharacterized protein (DUF2141 family)